MASAGEIMLQSNRQVRITLQAMVIRSLAKNGYAWLYSAARLRITCFFRRAPSTVSSFAEEA